MDETTRLGLLEMKRHADDRAGFLDYLIDRGGVIDAAELHIAKKRMLDWRQRALDISRVLNASPVSGVALVLTIDGKEERF